MYNKPQWMALLSVATLYLVSSILFAEAIDALKHPKIFFYSLATSLIVVSAFLVRLIGRLETEPAKQTIDRS